MWITKQNMVFGWKCGPALVAMLSKVLPLTASCLSSTRFESHRQTGTCKKVALLVTTS